MDDVRKLLEYETMEPELALTLTLISCFVIAAVYHFFQERRKHSDE